VGHALKNDLKVLMLKHPANMTRDTSKYLPFKKYAKGKHPALKTLAKELLGLEIQSGKHCSVEDAKVAMLIFKKVKNEWESKFKNK
jgi:RNA exonuclease 4